MMVVVFGIDGESESESESWSWSETKEEEMTSEVLDRRSFD